MMPSANRYILYYLGGSLECCPNNWTAFEMGIVRSGFGMNREITAELVFSGVASTWIQAMYATSKHQAVMTMTFEKRNNLWEYDMFNTFQADFSTYSIVNGKVSLTFIENSVRRLIDDNKSTEYEFPLPDESGTSDYLDYEGISYDKKNKLFIQPPRPTPTSPASSYKLTRVSTIWDALMAKKTIRESSAFYEMPYARDAGIRFKAACTPTIRIRAGVIAVSSTYDVSKAGAAIGVIRRAADGTVSLLTDNNNDPVSWDTEVSYGVDHKQLNFTINKEVVITNKTFATGEVLIFCVGITDASTDSVWVRQAQNSYMQIESIEPSLIVGRQIPIVSHEWMLEKLLRKMVPQFADEVAYPLASILDYNLPTLTGATTFALALSSSSGLTNADTPTIKSSFDKIMKSLGVQYGADYDITGNLMRVDYGDTFFTNVKAMDVEPVGEVTIKADTTHVYNRIVAGYETSDDATNGGLEYNCKNTFSIPNTSKDDKELNLVSPFIGSPFTIEQHLTDKEVSSTEGKNDDNSIFIFAVNPVVDHSTTLYRSTLTLTSGYRINKWFTEGAYRFYTTILGTTKIAEDANLFYYDYLTGGTYIWNGTEYVLNEADLNNLPVKAYNTVISPSQIIMANIRYIAISLGLSKIITFASTDRKADYYHTINGVKYYENAISPDLVTTPLFQAETVEFQTAQEFASLTAINGSLYKYFSFLDKNTGITHNYYIKDITLQLTRVDSQEWIGLTK